MANTSSSRAAGASQGASVAASETGGTPPESGAAAEKIQVVTGQRTAAVVQWPKASIYLGADAADTITLSSGRTAEVAGGWVVIKVGEEVPAEAGIEQAQHCIEIGAAASVVVPVIELIDRPA